MNHPLGYRVKVSKGLKGIANQFDSNGESGVQGEDIHDSAPDRKGTREDNLVNPLVRPGGESIFERTKGKGVAARDGNIVFGGPPGRQRCVFKHVERGDKKGQPAGKKQVEVLFVTERL